MNAAEYARHSGRRVREIEKFLEEGRVRGAREAPAGWDIPQDAKITYRTRKKGPGNVSDNIYDILKALHDGWYVDASSLHLSEDDFNDRVALLMEAGLIATSSAPRNAISSNGIRLTKKGVFAATQGKKQEILEVAQPAIEAITEGCTTAILEKARSIS